MAVNNVLSTAVSNRDSSPQIKNNDYLENGLVRESVAAVVIGTGDSVGSTYRLVQLPSSARVSELVIFSDQMGTTTAANIGVYDTTLNGSAAVSASLFAVALDLHTAARSYYDTVHSGGTDAISKTEKRLWELLGLAVDPIKVYDVVVTLTGIADAGGNLDLVAKYVI